MVEPHIRLRAFRAPAPHLKRARARPAAQEAARCKEPPRPDLDALEAADDAEEESMYFRGGSPTPMAVADTNGRRARAPRGGGAGGMLWRARLVRFGCGKGWADGWGRCKVLAHSRSRPTARQWRSATHPCTDPKQLLDVFTQLEEDNLFLIQNCQVG